MGSSRRYRAPLIAILALHSLPVVAQPIEEYRAFSVDTFNTRLNTHDDVASVVRDARMAGANAIFAQVRRRGDAWYVNALEPPPDNVPIEEGFDPLQDLIVEAHARGLEVHAFVIVGSFWNSLTPPSHPDHVFNRHGLTAAGEPFAGRDNWLTRTLLPDGPPSSVQGHRVGADFWMEPGHPDAAAYTVDVLTHLVRHYDIDGLHLDRIRYPEISVAGQTPATGAIIGYNDTKGDPSTARAPMRIRPFIRCRCSRNQPTCR